VIFRNFLKDRLRFIFREQGFRYDEINAVVEVCWDNPVESRKRLRAIAGMRESADFQSLATSFKRIKNILLKAEVDPRAECRIDSALFTTPEESLLHNQVVSTGRRISKALRAGRHETALEMMASLRPAVDSFFDRVLVMDENPSLRRNRLALLAFLLQTFLEVADVSEMVPATR
jgi:glycyl-tRNA synthetase beta chain